MEPGRPTERLIASSRRPISVGLLSAIPKPVLARVRWCKIHSLDSLIHTFSVRILLVESPHHYYLSKGIYCFTSENVWLQVKLSTGLE